MATDVLVIGAGLSGLFAALHLVEQGRTALVLEAREPGYGASGRNAAGCVPMWLGMLPTQVEAKLGAPGARLNALHAQAPSLLHGIVERHAIECDLRSRGATIFAHRMGAAPWLERLCAEWNTRGGRVTFDADATPPSLLFRTPAGPSATFHAAATVNPLALGRGLADAVQRLGGRIFARSPAIGLVRQAGGWTAVTRKARVTARHVVVATEGYEAIEGLTPLLARSYMRVPFGILVSAPVQDIEDILPDRRPIADTNRANPLWLMADAQDRLLLSMLPPAGRSAGLEKPGRLAARRLRRMFRALPVEWAHYWEADIAIGGNGLPRLMEMDENLVALGGYSGQGILPALIAGKELARRLDGQSDIALPVEAPRPMRGRSLVPWLLRYAVFPLARSF